MMVDVEKLQLPIEVPAEVTRHVPEYVLAMLAGGFSLVLISIMLLSIVLLVAWWRLFEKAEEPGWGIFIPIYNVWILVAIIQRPIWFFLLCLVPIVNIVLGVMVALDLGKVFGKSPLWSVIFLILLQPIGVMILAFGDDEYLPSVLGDEMHTTHHESSHHHHHHSHHHHSHHESNKTHDRDD